MRPAGVPSSLAMRFWCQPMADAVGYWTVPGASARSVTSFLAAHSPTGLTFEDSTGSNAASGAFFESIVEYGATADAQNGLVYEVTDIASGAGIRVDALEVPANAPCATGGIVQAWGG